MKYKQVKIFKDITIEGMEEQLNDFLCKHENATIGHIKFVSNTITRWYECVVVYESEGIPE